MRVPAPVTAIVPLPANPDEIKATLPLVVVRDVNLSVCAPEIVPFPKVTFAIVWAASISRTPERIERGPVPSALDEADARARVPDPELRMDAPE